MKKKKTTADRLQETLEGMLSLLVVVLLLAASVLYGGRLFGHDLAATSEEATATASLPSPEQLAALGIAEARLKAQSDDLWRATNAEGEAIGTVVTTERLGKDVQGYAGATPLLLLIGTDGRVRSIVPMANGETPDFFGEAVTLLERWKGAAAEEANTRQVDAISGATLSSRALDANVRLALNAYAQTEGAPSASAPGIGWGKAIAAIAVMLFGAYVHVYRKGKRWRIAVLTLNVLVLGFWTGQFISLGLLRSWTANGFDALTILPALVMLCMTVGLAFFGHKQHHCTWACPYGSLQDLAYRLPLPKFRVKPLVVQRMRRLRQFVLLLLLFLAWMGIGIEGILEYEPFSAFLFTVAAPGTIVLAVAFVVLSMFVPQVWCRALCPAGEILELASDMRRTVGKERKAAARVAVSLNQSSRHNE